MQLLLDSSFTQLVNNYFINVMFIDFVDLINIIKLIENCMKNFISIKQSTCDKETELEIELIKKSDVVQTHVISANQVTQTQRIIASVKNMNEVEKKRAIEKIIQLLYFYSSYKS